MLAVFSGYFTLEWTCSKRPLQLVIHMVQNRHAEKQDNTLGQDKQMARIIVFKMVTFFLCLVQVHPSLAFQHSSFVPWYLTILVTDGHSGVIGSAGSYLPVYKQEGNWVESGAHWWAPGRINEKRSDHHVTSTGIRKDLSPRQILNLWPSTHWWNAWTTGLRRTRGKLGHKVHVWHVSN